eukprot:233929-Prorocentrum_minimum.AAC.1
MYQSDAGSMGIFPRWTNQTQEAWVCSLDGNITCSLYGSSYANNGKGALDTRGMVVRFLDSRIRAY